MSPTNYAFLSQIPDPAVRRALKLLLDRAGVLESLSAGIGTVTKPLADHLDGGSNRIINLADPTADSHAVNLGTLKKYVAAYVAATSGATGAPTPPPPTPPPVPTDIPPPFPDPVDPGTGIRAWRGDFAGIRIAGSGYGGNDNFFSAFYPVYNPVWRTAYIAACQSRGYTHVPINIASGAYDTGSGVPYPAFDLSADPATFLGYLNELTNAGLFPVVFLIPDNNVLPGLNPGLPAADALGIIQAWFEPFISDVSAALSSIQIAAVGWELNGWLSPEAITAVCQYLRQVLGPTPLLYTHFTAAHNAGSDPGAAWWTSMQGILTGILYQDFNRDGNLLRDGCAELAIRFQGHNGWPTDSGFGHPFDVVAFEYVAYYQVRGSSEAEGVGFGDTAMHCNPPIQGYGNGGSV